jgi:hypothetical protein
MIWAGFEPTIPVFERSKTVHTLDRGLKGTHSAGRRISLQLEKYHLFLPSPIHACPPHDSWVTLSHERAKERVPDAPKLGQAS